MDSAFELVLGKIIGMYSIMISAYFLHKYLSYSVSDINNLVFSFFLPISIFYSFTNLSSFNLPDFLLMAGSGFIVIGLACLSAHLASYLFRMEPDTKKTFLLASSYGNYGFLGLPVAFSLLGAEGAVLSLFFLIGSYLFLYTIGLYIMKGKASLFGFFKNPLILTTLASLVFLVMDFRLNPLVSNTIALANQVTFPLSMFVVGGGLKFRFYLQANNLLINLSSIIIKLFLSPLFALLIGKTFLLSQHQTSILLLQSGMPTGVLVTVFSVAFGGNVALSNSLVSSTTLLSFATIVLILCV